MKKISLVGTFLVTSILLSGCFQQKTNMEIKKDDTASLTVEFTTKKDSPLASMFGKVTKESKAKAEKKGFTIDNIKTEERVGLKATKSVKDVKTLKVGDVLLSNDEEKKLKVYDEKFIKEIKDGKYIIDFTLGEKEKKSEDPEADAMAKAMMGDMKSEFILTLPSKPISNNATSVSKDGKTLTWDINLTGETPIKVEYKKQTFPIVPVAAGCVVILLVGGFLIIRKRSN